MRSPLDGCSDGYCKVLGPAKGMHTNGGCRCLRFPEDQKAFQEALASLKAEARTLRDAVEFVAGKSDLFFAECSDAEEIVMRCREALSLYPKSASGHCGGVGCGKMCTCQCAGCVEARKK